MGDRRSHQRRARRFMARFGVEAPTNLGFTLDLSSTGLFIKTTMVVPIGSKVTIVLTLQDDSSLNLIGTVIWNKRVPAGLDRVMPKNGIGVLLIDPPEVYLKFISSLDQPAGEKVKAV